MASKKRTGGGVFSYGDNLLGYVFNWIDPNGSDLSHRWQFKTSRKATEENRRELEELIREIQFEIEKGIFKPCERFPDNKIADFCRCPNCLVASPMAKSHLAPRTLKELKEPYLKHEKARATGDSKEIELSSYNNKVKLWNCLSSPVVFVDENDGATYEADALIDYEIGELTPEAVKSWLRYFQRRKDKKPVKTKYLINLLSEVELALKYGQFRRWWSRHALIDYQGTLLKSTKIELAEQKNKSLAKPFDLADRDRIIQWFRDWWLVCPETSYNGREKIRRDFLYRYVVIGFNTGLRSPSEMTALEWSDISYSRRELHVRKSRESSGRIDQQIVRPYTKTVNNRVVPINDMTLEALRALENYRQAEAEWLFWNPRAGSDNPFALANGWAPLTGEKRIRYAFTKCLKELKIERDENSQYAMRHTFATLLLDHTTFTDSKVAALIGDNVQTMKDHYAGFCQNRWRDEGDLDQMNQLNMSGSSAHLKAIK